jgi:hypothetical protein
MECNERSYALSDINLRPESRYLLNISLGGEGGRSGGFGGDKKSLNPTQN